MNMCDKLSGSQWELNGYQVHYVHYQYLWPEFFTVTENLWEIK